MRRRIVLSALSLVCLGVGLGALLLQPVPPASPDRSEHYSDVVPLPPLLPGAELLQEITARDDGLTEVLARFGTYGGARDCRIEVTVTVPAGPVVSSHSLRCAAIPDNALVVVANLDAAAVRAGDQLTMRFRAAEDGTEAVALWGGDPADGEVARLGTRSVDGAAEVYTRYGDAGRLVDRLGSVLSRIQQFRPWWGAPPMVIGLLAISVAGLAALSLVPARARLPLLLLVVAAKGVLWSVLLPPLEIPDEPAHFAYAQYVAEELAIPRRYSQAHGLGPFSDQLEAAIEVTNQPLRDPSDRPSYGPGPSGPDEHRPDDESPRAGGGGNPAAGYAPPFYVGAAVAYALPPNDFFTTLATMRLWSVALGVATIWLVVGIGRRAFRDERAALALGVAVAFQPVWSQATAGVNNDAAVVLAGAACTLVALDLAVRPHRARLPLVAGLVLGGALLTKPYAAAFVGPLVVGWLVGCVRERDRGRTWPRDVGQAAAGVVATFGTWLLLSTVFDIPMVTTDDGGSKPGARSVGGYLHQLSINGFHSLHLNWVERLWGNLSWTDTPPPPTIVSLVAKGTIAVLVLAAVWVVVTAVDVIRHQVRRSDGEKATDLATTLVLGSVLASTFALLHLIELRWFLRTGDATLLSGRYAMMALPAILALVPLMLRRLAPRLPVWVSMATLAGAVVALNLIGIDTVIDRFYV